MGGGLLFSLSLSLNLSFWAFLWLVGSAAESSIGAASLDGSYDEATVVVSASSAPIAVIDQYFICATLDWWPPEHCDFGTCSWGNASLLNLDLSNKILLNAVKEFARLKLRLGGSLQNKLIYGTDPQKPCKPFAQNVSEVFGFTEGCLPMKRWDELNDFFKKSGAVIIFGLNALNGRVYLRDSLGGPWDSTNAASFIRYTVSKKYTIHGWELGNELSGSGIGGGVGAGQYAADVITLNKIVDDIYQGFHQKPLVLGPGGFFDAKWFSEFINKTSPDSLDVVTHHIYNLGRGDDQHLTEKILDPSYLNGVSSVFRNLQEILREAGTKTTAWVGEAGGATSSGRHLVTDTFVFSLWYLDQLGMSSTYGTKVYCRQSLIGGNYGLLNTMTFHPNPDYYSALLWHRLMGNKVLAPNFKGTKKIRAYAHCARRSQGVTLLLINLGGNTTQISAPYGGSLPEHKREEYHLTAKEGDIHSQTMLLNDKILSVDSEGNIPRLNHIEVRASEPITVAPFSIVFAHIPSFNASACT